MSLSPNQTSSIVADVFGDLPDALINELLLHADIVADRAGQHVNAHILARDELRQRAHRLGLINSLPDLTQLPAMSVSAVDGSAVSIRLASFDLNSAAALAVDGIGFLPTGTGIRHDITIHVTDPIYYGREIAYALMFCMEYDISLQEAAIRDLVMLDGAFSSGVIAISKALTSALNLNDDLSNSLYDRWTSSTAQNVSRILTTDRIIALPKRSWANEFATQTRLFDRKEVDTNGRSTANLILEPMEYSGPFHFDTRTPQYQPPGTFAEYWRNLQRLFETLRVVYFKPRIWSHAHRIELPAAIANDEQRLHETLECVRRQTSNQAMMEPYPLYVADRFAKSLSKGVRALQDTVRREVIGNADQPDLAHSMLNSYRTDPVIEEEEE